MLAKSICSSGARGFAKAVIVIMAGAGLALSIPAAARAEFTAPTLDTYPDAGQLVGMKWDFVTIENNVPTLAFAVPETDNVLWRFRCEKYGEERHVVGNQILADPINMKPGDRFGMTLRVDSGESFGIVARMDKATVEGEAAYFPYFRLTKGHSMWDALRKGKRAYIDLGARRFSIHLNGSGKAINSFLDACGD